MANTYEEKKRYVKEYIRSLKEIEKMDFTTAVFTHGKPVGTKADITEMTK